MKILIALGVSIALGFAFKKSEKIKEAKFVIVDDRENLSEYFCDPEGQKAFKKFFEQNGANLGV